MLQVLLFSHWLFVRQMVGLKMRRDASVVQTHFPGSCTSLRWGTLPCQLGPCFKWWWLPGKIGPFFWDIKEWIWICLDEYLYKQKPKPTLSFQVNYQELSAYTDPPPLFSLSLYHCSYAPAFSTNSSLSASFSPPLSCTLYKFSPVHLPVCFVSFIVKPIYWCFGFPKTFYFGEFLNSPNMHMYKNSRLEEMPTSPSPASLLSFFIYTLMHIWKQICWSFKTTFARVAIFSQLSFPGPPLVCSTSRRFYQSARV